MTSSTLPRVTIICLCYNHALFIQEALDSVLAQTYPNLEIIIVDDCSTDGSRSIIDEYLINYPQLKFISTGQNKGSCAAFNMGWRASTGDFIIDFATDDVLLPKRIAQQVEAFEKLDKSYGVVYTDAEYIDNEGAHLYYHHQKYMPAPDGDVFAEILGRYFISSTTMMVRREVFEKLGGYDEQLYYEDFDFWIRSARVFKYHYLDCVTTKRRVHKQAMSQQWYTPNDPHLLSHVLILKKAIALLRSETEKKAMVKRLEYEARQVYFSGNFTIGDEIFGMMHQVYNPPLIYKLLEALNSKRINLTLVRKMYIRLKYGKN